MPKCTYCKLVITQEELDNGKAHYFIGVYSHKKCDEDALEKIDRRMHVITRKDNFEQ